MILLLLLLKRVWAALDGLDVVVSLLCEGIYVLTLRRAENDRSLVALVAGATSIRTTSFTTSEK